MADTDTPVKRDPPPIWKAALGGKCPSCGQATVWRGYLKLKDECEVCRQDFTGADTGDGPAFFVNFAALILFLPILFVLPVSNLPLWGKVVGMIGVTALMVAFCLAALPATKALLLSLKIRNRAGEGRAER